MSYLVIYDTTGRIISGPMQGNITEPVGIPFMWVEVPEGKILTGINVTNNPHEPVFEDMPVPEYEVKIQKVNNVVETTAVAVDILFTEFLPMLMN